MAIVLMLLLLTGCAVGPNYTSPALPVPAAFDPHLPPDTRIDPVPPAPETWWALLGDKILNDLIKKAVGANLDIRIAKARLRESRAGRNAARAGLFPAIDASGSVITQRQSENSPSTLRLPPPLPSPSLTSDLYEIGFDAAWEIDVFGGVRRSAEAADARLAAVRANRDDVIRIVLAEVALNYIELRGLQRRKAVLERNIRVQQDTLAFTRNRLASGLGAALEVSQARAQLLATEAALPGIDAGIQLRLFQINTLLGEHPGDRRTALMVHKALPALPDALFSDIPSEVLRRRPDVRSAERRLAAEIADIGVATADLFPKFSLLGGIGLASASGGDLFESASRFWRLGPSMRWSLFQGGRIRANIEAQKAQSEASLAQYEKTVLTVLQEVNTALVDHGHERKTAASLKTAMAESQRSVDLSTALYQEGLSDILTVLNTESRLLTVEDEYARSLTREWTSLIRLYKALGGGWSAGPG